MVCFAMPARELLKHVVRSPEIYLIPRSDGRILAGATVEEAGFDKRTSAQTIQRLHHAALAILPELRKPGFSKTGPVSDPARQTTYPSSARPQHAATM